MNKGVGAVLPIASGQVTVNPLETTTYRAIAQGGGAGSVPDTSTVTIQVSGVTPPDPVIDSFVTDDAAITSEESTTLRWETTNATAVSIESDVGVSPSGELMVDGSWDAFPQETTVYTLKARNVADVEVTAEVTVAVTPISARRLLVTDITNDRLWGFDHEGENEEGTNLRGFPVDLQSPTALAVYEQRLLVGDSFGTGNLTGVFEIDPDGSSSQGSLLRAFLDASGMTVLNGRVLILESRQTPLSDRIIEYDVEANTSIVLRSIPTLQNPGSIIAYQERILIGYGTTSLGKLFEIDPDGANDEGTELRDLPVGSGAPNSMAIFENQLLVIGSGGIWNVDPDGADDEGTQLRDLPVAFGNPGGSTVLGGVPVSIPIIDSFMATRSGNQLTFTWTTTGADEVTVQFSTTGAAGSYLDIYTNLPADGSDTETFFSLSAHFRLKAVSGGVAFAYSDGIYLPV